jgi:hypothetical protein
MPIGEVTKRRKFMRETNVERRFDALDESKKIEDYNFEHFRTGILLDDAQRTVEGRGVCPGEIAPDFELPQVGGGSRRLSDLRRKPLILHFGSYS